MQRHPWIIVGRVIDLINYLPLRWRVATSPRAIAGAIIVGISWFMAMQTQESLAQDSQWIWTPEQDALQAPLGSAYFRKMVTVENVREVTFIGAADDQFTIFVNGKRAGSGTGFQSLTRVDLTPHFKNGENLIAVQVVNSSGPTAAFACQVKILEGARSTPRWIGSDESWKTLAKPPANWRMAEATDKTWNSASELGKIGMTLPWDAERIALRESSSNQATAAAEPGKSSAGKTNETDANANQGHLNRFIVPDNFAVRKILDDSAGSIIAMEFNEFGQLLVSREQGGIYLVDFNIRENNGKPRVSLYCDAVKSCQGILPINGDVYVTGAGPQGVALYRLIDSQGSGKADQVEMLVKFAGPPSEHGPHGMVLGPDGLIYISLGNMTGLDGKAASTSPAKHFYDVDMLPRQEDRAGHAAGIKAPGGTVIRVSLDGKRREIVASGIRNTYDLAINSSGEMFFHDSDMEADLGTPWYRPTQVYHLLAGADYGWRSGWAKFPYYYIDCHPGICDTGRGSPTGAVVYDHVIFPYSYHGALFLADWSEGRILAVKLEERGASYQASYEVFLESQPLAVTDLTVGPDGALYFCTGGRGTEGAVYRVSWEGTVPPEFTNLENELAQLIRQPQPQSAWGRQQLAKLKDSIGLSWGDMLKGVALESRNNAEFRVRALNLMFLYGPRPSDELLQQLCTDSESAVRAKAVEMLGWLQNQRAGMMLSKALIDESSRVRMKAANAMVRLGMHADWNSLQQLLKSEDPAESLAARRLLETTPVDRWRDDLLKCDDQKVFAEGALVLITVEPKLENAYAILAKISHFMEEFISDDRFIELLRIAQIALKRGNVDPTKIKLFGERIANEFPAGNGILNREISRLNAFLGNFGVVNRLPEYLDLSENDVIDKLQVVLNWQVFAKEMTSEQRLQAIAFLEESIVSINEIGHRQYTETALNAYLTHVTEADIPTIIAAGAQWPYATLHAFYKLPNTPLSDQMVIQLIEMDKQLLPREDSIATQCKLGIIALLGERGNDVAHEYLRSVWLDQPQRRSDIAMGLAQRPDSENWPYLVESLADVSDDTLREVITKLLRVQQRPVESKHYRNVITVAHRLRNEGGNDAIKLLNHWSGDQQKPTATSWKEGVDSWSKWFEQKFPDAEPIDLSKLDSTGKHNLTEYLDYFETNVTALNVARGQQLFNKAQCTQCHRFDKQGDTLGPDLTSLSKRFSKRETLEAIIFPSRHISDQYLARKVMTTDGRMLVGMLSRAPDGSYIIVASDGKKNHLRENEIEQIAVSSESAMPSGLLDNLTKEEIGDLLAYLYKDILPRTADRNSNRGEAR
ncbi:MAG TPA: HEAT repeat domain-containing protein [Pirellulaceae bacterium]|nr:HEAT repeat domain-containing protein [Pirellulaceae bacterium]HMO91641.1 HEAT repeat domain-containing protein [Pirellulaceae bacterium]HMP68338.1 HEAT repeat domain-containing protein [Pirellulaceae bacterium]